MDTAKPRARDLGVPFDGEPGPLNAITDVAGVAVGHVTLVSGGAYPGDVGQERFDRGDARSAPGRSPAPGEESGASAAPEDDAPRVRTGVTGIHPLGKGATDGVLGGRFALNGNGEMTGTSFLDEFGTIYGPIALTNTLSVGLARDAVVGWCRENVGFGHAMIAASLPVAAETWDGQLNDIYGFHVTREDVFAALDRASTGPVEEGSVGGGTGMTSYGFKAGIGTASRRVATAVGTYTVGVLVQANYGKREQLIVAGVPVGREIADLLPAGSEAPPADARPPGDGSIIAIVATDAPLLPTQLRAVAKRVSLGLGRIGSIAAHSSGDLFLAFSTAGRIPYGADELLRLDAVPTTALDPVYEGTVQATEEAVVNALVAAETMTGVGGRTFHALPHDRLRDVLARYGRLAG